MQEITSTRKNRGAIVVEATAVLPIFIFAIYIILSIVDVCYVQAKISMALDSAAEDISQYSYLYYRFGIDNLQSSLHESEGVEEARGDADDLIEGAGEIKESIGEAKESADTILQGFDNMKQSFNNGTFSGDTSLSSDDFDSLMDSLNGVSSSVKDYGDTISGIADSVAEDPKTYMIGMGKMLADELSGEANALLARIMAKAFMKKNLKSTSSGDPDTFLRRYHVKDGLNGLDFFGSMMMTYGISNNIQLVCTYEIEVIELLGFKHSVKFRQCAKTTAWGNGVSKVEPAKSTTSKPDSLWNKTNLERGRLIKSYELEKYPYKYAGSGADAYNNKGGANEFIQIVSIDTNASSYDTASKMKSQLKKSADKLKDNASGFSESITVSETKNSNKEITISSNPATRTYKLVVVVPDDADMSVVNEAKSKLLEELNKDGNTFSIEIATGYGNSKKEEKEE